jgi:hypothetical protein
MFTLTVANAPGNPTDWITFGPVTATDSDYFTWEFLNGLMVAPATGLTNVTLQFQAPLNPGEYHIRFFLNGGWSRLATSSTITVQ